MQPTETNPGKRPGQGLPGTARGRDRFDGESARRILQRAAAEQQRLSNELADSYSLEELEEIGAEAGISPEALRAAVEAHEGDPATAAAIAPLAPDARPRPRLPAVRKLMSGNWSTPLKGGALAAAGSIGFVALLLAFPAIAQMVLWALLALLIVLSVLIVLGAVPF